MMAMEGTLKIRAGQGRVDLTWQVEGRGEPYRLHVRPPSEAGGDWLVTNDDDTDPTLHESSGEAIEAVLDAVCEVIYGALEDDGDLEAAADALADVEREGAIPWKDAERELER